MDRLEKLEAYFSKAHHFQKGIQILRDLALKTKAEETFKWRAPVYAIDGKNVFWIARFKNHFGVGFFNGVFLKDPKNVLVNAQEGKTQAMRHWHFRSIDEIDKRGVLAYMNESLENQKKGMELVPKKKTSIKVTVPKLLKDALAEKESLNQAFKGLSPYNQKEYSDYIANAKQEKTKESRLEKILPLILDGKGLNDKYK